LVAGSNPAAATNIPRTPHKEQGFTQHTQGYLASPIEQAINSLL